MTAPRLLSHGKDAMAQVSRILPSASPVLVPSSMGDVELRPGTIFSNNKMLVYATPMTTYYTIDDRLYEYGTSDFIRAEYLNALSAGAARAMPMVYLAKAETALLMGIFVPWYGMLGLTAAKIGLLYSTNKREFNVALQKAPIVLRLLQDLRQRHPTLFKKLMTTAAKEVLFDLPSGVGAEDVAFFIGRVIRGIAGLPDVTMGALVKLVRNVALMVAGLHLPSIAAHGVAASAARRAETLRMQLASQGIHISREEANTILQELISDRDSLRKLQELEKACNELIPVLKQLAAAIHS